MAQPKKDSTKGFGVNVRIHLDTTVSIRANSLAEAIQDANAMKIEDFIEIHGDNNENVIAVKGVFEFTTNELKA